VSRALHGRGRVSANTRQQILQLAQDLGYTPSLIARGLVTQRTFCVGLVVTTLADPFHSEIAQGIEEEARQHGYSLFLTTTQIDPIQEQVSPEHELAVVRNFQARQVDGLIVCSSRAGNRYAELCQETGIPIVLINTHVDGQNMHTVQHDDYGGGCQLVRHLIQQHYRRIAYLGNERGMITNQARQQAWADTMNAAGFMPELSIAAPNGRFNGGAAGMEQLLAQSEQLWGSPPEAVCCYNDTMAIGAMSFLRRHQLKIPEDVAIVGFDDIEVAAFVQPPLTTLRQPRREMGEEAMRLLLTLIEHPSPLPLPQAIVIPGELVIRSST
jgi:LacI family transcriptional regulator/LacI family repressor for deo operon, udp, cdd, tsx, nupC, and nupG